jgi:glycosyltransferase involved in cell wall biosynthesis
MSNNLLILSKDWVRHGKYSGYERLINAFSFPLNFARKTFLPYTVASFYAKKTRLVNYKSPTVIKEWLILLQLFKKKTIHVLYGDMDYYYLHYLKFFPFNFRRNTIIATFHHPPNELENRLNYNRSKVLGALDKIIVMGPNQIPFLEKYTEADLKFIPHGINTEYFKYEIDQNRKNQIVIIGVSHRDHERNIKIIKEVNRRIDVRFEVIVTEDFADQYFNLKNVVVTTNKISDDVLLTYYQESKGMLLSLIDCTASNSILEALACGCPLIINNVGAVRDYIPESSGIPVFQTDQIENSAEYIVNLMTDNNLLKSIAIKQRSLAKKYNWKIIAKATEDFILQ